MVQDKYIRLRSIDGVPRLEPWHALHTGMDDPIQCAVDRSSGFMLSLDPRIRRG